MDAHLLRSWLGLPPGPWPPDHYTLLGLPPGSADPAAVESLVLDRMGRLRAHQLRHPELVTEGMNRLAQALITLTDPDGKAAYDAEIGVAVGAMSAPEPTLAGFVVVAGPVADEATDEPATAERPDRPDRTQVIEIPTFPTAAELAPRTADEPIDRPGRAGVIEAAIEDVKRSSDPETRRWIYKRLVFIRRALQGWDRLQPVLGDPAYRLARPANVLVLLEAARQVQGFLPQLNGIIGGPGEPGWRVVAVLNQPVLLAVFRGLLPEQRQSLASDWQGARAELRRELRRLRRLATGGRPRRGRRRFRPLRAITRSVVETPEVVLVLLAALGIAAALVRSRFGW